MKKIVSIVCLFFVVQQAALAMPCEFSYHCVSASKKYDVVLGICDYMSDPSLRSVTIGGQLIKDATLASAYDGTYDKGPLAFDINLPTTGKFAGNDLRTLTVEIPPSDKEAKRGIIKEKVMPYNPGEYKTLTQEPVVCTFSD